MVYVETETSRFEMFHINLALLFLIKFGSDSILSARKQRWQYGKVRSNFLAKVRYV